MSIINSISSHPLWLELNKKFKIIGIAPASHPNCDLSSFAKIPGINIEIPENMLSTSASLYHANYDSERLRVLKEALYAEEDIIIWAIRGGYGSLKLIKHL